MADFYPQTLVDYAQIVGAIATSAAVILSLYLANKKPKPDLRVSCDVRDILWQGQQVDERPKYLVISAVNTGNVDAIIMSVGWKLSGLLVKNKWAYQVLHVGDQLTRNPVLPVKVAHGETVQFFLPLQGDDSWIEYLKRNGMFADEISSRLAFNNLRSAVFTSVGKPFLCKPNSAALDLLWTHQQTYLLSKKQSELVHAQDTHG